MTSQEEDTGWKAKFTKIIQNEDNWYINLNQFKWEKLEDFYEAEITTQRKLAQEEGQRIERKLVNNLIEDWITNYARVGDKEVVLTMKNFRKALANNLNVT